MKNFSPMDYAIKRIENVEPSMRYDGTESFEVWQEKAYNKVYELLGLDKFEKCDLDIEIEYDKIVEDRREIRFTFQSEEGYYAIARMTFPKNISKPLPLYICLQGHSYGMHRAYGETKYEDEEKGLRAAHALRMAKENYCAVAIDQRGMGESGGTYPNACDGCYRPSMYEIMLGRTTIGTRVWDVMRLIDAVTERFSEFADVSDIICMGSSGGGTATFYSACIDKRITMAVPGYAVSAFKKSMAVSWHCSCNYVPGIANYFDMGDLAGLIAPRKMMIVSGKVDPIFLVEGAEECFAIAKEMYKKLNAEENCKLLVTSEGHRFLPDEVWHVFDEFKLKGE